MRSPGYAPGRLSRRVRPRRFVQCGSRMDLQPREEQGDMVRLDDRYAGMLLFICCDLKFPNQRLSAALQKLDVVSSQSNSEQEIQSNVHQSTMNKNNTP